MSTNAIIAYLKEDGSIISSYVHYDGYTTEVGLTLQESFANKELALKVASAGYFSSLSENISESANPARYEEGIMRFVNYEELHHWLLENGHIEYAYLWTDNQWLVADWFLDKKGVGMYAEYKSIWNGFIALPEKIAIEAKETIKRLKKMAEERIDGKEYLVFADSLELRVKPFLLN